MAFKHHILAFKTPAISVYEIDPRTGFVKVVKIIINGIQQVFSRDLGNIFYDFFVFLSIASNFKWLT